MTEEPKKKKIKAQEWIIRFDGTIAKKEKFLEVEKNKDSN